ncbi:MAG: hypothetical protein K2Q01_11075 [Rickettsiales bacterium]|nr:hypothetical protein [Rickettsiales bacterium]
MVYVLMGMMFLAMLLVLKIVKGVIKLVLFLVLLGLLIATFAGKDEIESSTPAASAPSI